MGNKRQVIKRQYRDFDALAYEHRVLGDDDHLAVNHIQKRLKTKATEVVFDPAHHKEFITGFRKRKQQRRTKAIKQLEDKAKLERLQMRAEKRTKLKADLGLDDRWGVESSSSDDDNDTGRAAGAVTVYADQGVTTTVTSLALDSGPDSSSDEDDDEEGRPQTKGPSHGSRGPPHSGGQGGPPASGPSAPAGRARQSKAALAWSRKHGGDDRRKDKAGGGAASRLQKLTSIMKKGSKGGGGKKKAAAVTGGKAGGKAGRK